MNANAINIGTTPKSPKKKQPRGLQTNPGLTCNNSRIGKSFLSSPRIKLFKRVSKRSEAFWSWSFHDFRTATALRKVKDLGISWGTHLFFSVTFRVQNSTDWNKLGIHWLEHISISKWPLPLQKTWINNDQHIFWKKHMIHPTPPQDIYLGKWTNLILTNLKLIRQSTGMIPHVFFTMIPGFGRYLIYPRHWGLDGVVQFPGDWLTWFQGLDREHLCFFLMCLEKSKNTTMVSWCFLMILDDSWFQ